MLNSRTILQNWVNLLGFLPDQPPIPIDPTSDRLVIADLETNGLHETATQVWCISLIDLDEPDAVYHYGPNALDEGVERLEASVIIGHNFLDYDLRLLKDLLGARIDHRRVIDTLVLSRLGFPDRLGGHSLAAWGERLGFPKVEHEDWSRYSPAMRERCDGDVELNLLVFERLAPMLELQPLAVLLDHYEQYYLSIARKRGVPLNETRAASVASQMMAENEVMLEPLRRLFPPRLKSYKPGDPVRKLSTVNCRHPLYGMLDPDTEYCPLVEEVFNPGSHQQIALRLQQRGWVPKSFTATGLPEVTGEILRDIDPVKIPEAAALADYLDREKLISQIMSEPKSNGFGGGWLHHCHNGKVYPGYHHDTLGRVHPNWIATGTITGRPSCSSPNLQQVSRDPRMRECWEAPPGYLFVGCDQSALQLRALAHRVAPYDGGKYASVFESGEDIHSHNQALIGFYDRHNTKTAIYALVFGAQNPKLGAIALADAQQAKKEINWQHYGLEPGADLAEVGKGIRQALIRGITGMRPLLRDLNTAARKTQPHPRIHGLDGRTLRVRGMHAILNLLLQSDEAIIMKVALILTVQYLDRAGICPIEDMDVGLVLFVHDEDQFLTREEDAEEAAALQEKAMADAGRLLNIRCPLKGEAKIGKTWKDTH